MDGGSGGGWEGLFLVHFGGGNFVLLLNNNSPSAPLSWLVSCELVTCYCWWQIMANNINREEEEQKKRALQKVSWMVAID